LTQLWPLGHVVPQAPQLLALVLVLTQVKPAAAVPQQVVPIGHLVQCPPQLLLELMDVQVPPQLVVPAGQIHVVPEQVPPLGQVVHVPPQQVRPLQHDVPEGQDVVEHFLFVGAFGEPGVGVVPAAASSSEGSMAPATPAAMTFSALRRVSGFANFRVSSSKRSALMLSLVPRVVRPGRKAPSGQKVYARSGRMTMGASDPNGLEK
jgi:hypothetical protein